MAKRAARDAPAARTDADRMVDERASPALPTSRAFVIQLIAFDLRPGGLVERVRFETGGTGTGGGPAPVRSTRC